MILIENVLGNVADPCWAELAESNQVDTLVLDHWEAQKSRLRKRSAGGIELAISLDRNHFLRDGDVLHWDAQTPTLILARLRLRDVMLIELDELLSGTTGEGQGAELQLALRTCVELGHALGNQHWPALVKGTRIYVPLTVDRQVMRSVMKTHGFDRIRYDFVPGSDIVPYLAPHESRRLFGAAEGPVHSHHHDHSNGHA